MNLRPIAHNIAVRPGHFIESDTERMFLLPDNMQCLSGTVIATGPGKRLGDGGRRPMQVAVGDRIAFGQYAVNEEVDVDGETVLMMSEDDVLGVLET